MVRETSVLVIFEHELLGEGVAARLQKLGIRALTVKSCDDDAIVVALRSQPEVIVVECHNAGCLDRIQRLSPTSRVVDASATVGRGYPTETLRFDVILEALGAEPQRETPA